MLSLLLDTLVGIGFDEGLPLAAPKGLRFEVDAWG